MPYEEYEDFEDVSADIPPTHTAGPGQEEKPAFERGEEETAKDVEEIAKGVDPERGSILTDETALSALGVLKNVLFDLDCKLMDFRVGFEPTGFDIKGLSIRCSNPQKVLDALKEIETVPGQLKPQSMYDKMPNSYAISAILGTLKRRAKDELGLDLRAAAYENDYVVLSFFPAEQEEEPMGFGGEEMGLEGEEMGLEGEEMAPEGEEPGLGEEGEGEGEEGLEEIPEEGVPADEIDWDALGI
jgi:hypothetical protein